MNLLDIAQHGANLSDYGLFLNRVSLGVFFAASGYHKLFNKGRHASLVETLQTDHVPEVRFNQWFVPSWEFIGGLSLALGFISAFAAAVLAIICIVACLVDGYKRVNDFQPIDLADRIDDWLYLPETLYVIGLTVVILCGPGAFSL